MTITIIGGGLAGCEAAWQAASRGCRVVLHEMKPQRFSPAHSSADLAERNVLRTRSNNPAPTFWPATGGFGLLPAPNSANASIQINRMPATIAAVPAVSVACLNTALFANTWSITRPPSIL